MKFTRFESEGVICQGVVEKENIREITGDLFTKWEYTGRTFIREDVKLLAPVQPNQIIGIGANYVKDVSELPEKLPDIPVFFFKPISSVIGPGEDIIIPEGIEEVKFESELAVVIGKEAKKLSASNVREYIFGYTIGNDVTAPQFIHPDGHWTVGKSFDTFTPLGPYIETELDLANIRVKATLDGIEKQNSGMDLIIISVEKMIAYLSNVMTLKPGDVILTGSPVGAELVGAGSIINCHIDEIGSLKNTFSKVKVSVN